MPRFLFPIICLLFAATSVAQETATVVTLNQQAAGYRGIWYMNQPSGDEYVYKYSGGLGTYCAKHKPFAVYCERADKTFFCYGGATADNHRRLLHMVSYFDHKTKQVPRPTILLDKKTNDAHDNPVISVDDEGYIWIFSTSHGRSRPSYVHRSRRPYEIDEFELVTPTRQDGDKRVALDNFSYMQSWHLPGQGFACFFTRYGYPAKRTICFMTSPDGRGWSEWQRLAVVDEGHYQVSGTRAGKVGTSFNYHPDGKGLNWRTNLYYIESSDLGESWQSADGQDIKVPVENPDSVSLVHDYQSDGLNVYLKDLRYDAAGRPVILYVTSSGYQSGPQNDPRTWHIAHWVGNRWSISDVTTSDNNYDMGSLWIEGENDWRVIAPTASGPQRYNPGGEVEFWQSKDRGASWRKLKTLTAGSKYNHTYVRQPTRAHPDFYAFWADGHGRKPSESRLYFADRDGTVRMLPLRMDGAFATPEIVKIR